MNHLTCLKFQIMKPSIAKTSTQLIKTFGNIGLADLPAVGGKNASLGEMFSQLSSKGIKVPNGFAATSAGFWLFIEFNNLKPKLSAVLSELDKKDFSNLRAVGAKARQLIMEAKLPTELGDQIISAYHQLFANAEPGPVAVRSSATAEDLPTASFAGQHESYLNIMGDDDLLLSVLKCYASLFTDRAIKYREDNGFDQMAVALSVGVQKMVRSDLACSGVGFTLEPESGFKDIILLTGV